MPIVSLLSDNYRSNNSIHSFTTHLERPIYNASHVALLNITFPIGFNNIRDQLWSFIDANGNNRDIYVKGVHVKNIEDVFSFVNQVLTKIELTVVKSEANDEKSFEKLFSTLSQNLPMITTVPKLDFEITSGRVVIKNETPYEFELNQVGEILGFDRHYRIVNGLNTAKYSFDILNGLHNILIYTDIVTCQHYQSGSIPLLDQIPLFTVYSVNDQPFINYEKTHIIYKPTSKPFIDRITISFHTSHGEFIHFNDTSSIYLTLNIKDTDEI